MYVITAHQRHGRTDGQTDVKRSHDRYIAKACSGKKIQKYPRSILPGDVHYHISNFMFTKAGKSCFTLVWSKNLGIAFNQVGFCS